MGSPFLSKIYINAVKESVRGEFYQTELRFFNTKPSSLFFFYLTMCYKSLSCESYYLKLSPHLIEKLSVLSPVVATTSAPALRRIAENFPNP